MKWIGLMNYGDLSSVVQLGVGLHAGTALLQLYGELGVGPLERILSRIRALLQDGRRSESDRDKLARLESDFNIFRIHLFNEYKTHVKANSIVAIALAAILVFLAFRAQAAADLFVTILFVVLSLVPSPLSLAILWVDANQEMRPIMRRAQDLEEALLK